MSVTIDEADLNDPDDARAVLALLQSYAADPMGGAAPLSPDVCANLIPRLKQVDSRLILLARADDQPAGVAVSFQVFSTFKAAPVLNLHDLAVDPRFRGQGIGRQLLQKLEVIARERGCCRISLEVRRDNLVAQGLYQSQGFSAGSTPQEFWVKALT